MKFTSLAATLSSLLALATALPHAHTPEQLETRQSTNLVITSGQPTIQPRYEIRQLQSQQPDQWSLFILTLNWWQHESQNSATSYYGVAGIHGVPHQNYNNVGQCSSCNADGYCPHNSILFPAWHRTYVATFEQQFLQRAAMIAGAYSGDLGTRMQAAAKQLRWPYWDWAAKPASGNSLPDSVTSAQITVTGPSGSTTITNPLAAFAYNDPSPMYYGPFNQWPSTMRYPNSNNANAQSQQSSAIAAFQNVRASLQDQVYQLFATCTDYAHFSNDVADSSSTSCSNSLEGIHNTVHMTAGGQGGNGVSGGHMTYLPLAAFDPVFWLHHANVDRLFAMWQTVNPNAYGGSQVAPDNTWTIPAGSTQNSNSPLTPFYKSSSAFWTTNDVRQWNTTFGYTYPEFADSKGDRAAIVNYVKALYGPNASKTAGSSKREAEPEAFSPSSYGSSSSSSKSSNFAASNGSTYEYVANIQTPRYYLNGSYTIYLFSGKPSSEDPTQWVHDKHLVGPMGVMADSVATSMADVMISGSIPLTRTLLGFANSGLLTSLEEALIAPFLKANLAWRVAGPQGQSVDPSTIPGFAVSVVVATVAPSSDPTQLPSFSPFNTLVSVTEGLAGGLNATTSLLGDAFKGLGGLSSY